MGRGTRATRCFVGPRLRDAAAPGSRDPEVSEAHDGAGALMIRSSVRSAGLAILLTMNGCGDLVSSLPGGGAPGLEVAEAALRSGASQIALQVSNGVLRRSPNDTSAMAVKGDALALLGDYDA